MGKQRTAGLIIQKSFKSPIKSQNQQNWPVAPLQQEKEPGTYQKGSAKLFFLWYNIIEKELNQRKDRTTKMRICQVRMNMNFDVYIEENSQVRLLNDVIDEIYFTKDYTAQSE